MLVVLLRVGVHPPQIGDPLLEERVPELPVVVLGGAGGAGVLAPPVAGVEHRREGALLHRGEDLAEAVGRVETARHAALAVEEERVDVREGGEVRGRELHVVGVVRVPEVVEDVHAGVHDRHEVVFGPGVVRAVVQGRDGEEVARGEPVRAIVVRAGAEPDLFHRLRRVLAYPAETEMLPEHPRGVQGGGARGFIGDGLADEVGDLRGVLHARAADVRLRVQVDLAVAGAVVGFAVDAVGVLVERAVEVPVVQVRRDVRAVGPEAPDRDDPAGAAEEDVVRAPILVRPGDEVADAGLVVLAPRRPGPGEVRVDVLGGDDRGTDTAREAVVAERLEVPRAWEVREGGAGDDQVRVRLGVGVEPDFRRCGVVGRERLGVLDLAAQQLPRVLEGARPRAGDRRLRGRGEAHAHGQVRLVGELAPRREV